MKRYFMVEDQRGAVSLFVVIFTALIVTVMTVSFVRLMIDGQRSAADADLSRSALDSAQAGVEDAKRAIVKYRSCLNDRANPACGNILDLVNDTSCQVLQNKGIAGLPSDKEVLIKQDEGDKQLQQAYTCVKIEIDSKDYIGTATKDEPRIIPLRGVEDFNQIRVTWFSAKDLEAGSDIELPTLGSLVGGSELPKQDEWTPNRPSLMRAQLIQYGDSFTLDQFDSPADGGSNANTLFLYPSPVDAPTYDFANDSRRAPGARSLVNAKCDPSFSAGSSAEYACEAVLTLPKAIGQSAGRSDVRTAYLNLTGLYQKNHFKIELLNVKGPAIADSHVVKFSGVQAVVDSTGRADNKFRRVESRVELDANTFQYPTATANTGAGFCKNLFVTDDAAEYQKSDEDC